MPVPVTLSILTPDCTLAPVGFCFEARSDRHCPHGLQVILMNVRALRSPRAQVLSGDGKSDDKRKRPIVVEGAARRSRFEPRLMMISGCPPRRTGRDRAAA
ncbi:hypothetical protein EVAR_19726_1 [Eumeta japonica]|uniref:Uncharacterized protein n=1 Tax=Eumeta variegata TaxID=151549 RepID=A0A4C1UQH1_EUMVA|nr:hypothetical protein EVAR_19726_1 [Eumeta japonica]